MQGYKLGVDVGGTAIKAGVVSDEGVIVAKYAKPIQELRQGAFIDNLVEWISSIVEQHPVSAMGFGIPGLISADCSEMLEVPNLTEIEGKQLVAAFYEAFPSHDFYFSNDANAAALGAYCYSKEIISSTFGFLTLGTGVGSAVILNGSIYTGQNGNGPEVGMLPIGNDKILESVVGKEGLIELALMAYHQNNPGSILPKCYSSTESLFEVACNNDPLAISVFHEAGKILGQGLAIFILMFDIKTIYIGGGISPCLRFMRQQMNVSLQKALTPYYLNGLSILEISLGNDAGILGAAALCKE
jgi:glucokinase